jgi:enamine deaminase RidA (YjgF/YER057c/UK114 family)
MPNNSNLKLSNPPQLHKPTGYSHVAEVTPGKMIYISGQVALDASGNIVGHGDYRAQIQQVFRNLKTALESAGASFQNVVKLNYYIVDTVEASEFFAYREVRDQYLDTSNPPAATVIVISRLFRPEFLIEIEGIAVV